MDLSLLLTKALAFWSENMALAGVVFLLLWWLFVHLWRGRAGEELAHQHEEPEAVSEGGINSSAVELLSVFQVISTIIDHEAVQIKMVEDVLAHLVIEVLAEMEGVGVQGVAVTVNETRYESGICDGDGWYLERVIEGAGSKKETVQFYGAVPDSMFPTFQQKICLKISDYLAGHLASFISLKRSMQEVALFRHLIDQASEIILSVDPLSGKILDVNARACIELGYAPHELAGKRLSFILSSGKDDVFVENKTEKYGHEMFMETKLVRQDKTTFPVEMSLKNIDLAGRQYQLVMARDLSARNDLIKQKMEMERQLIQSEKMASVGQLSAGIAHEINNPISFITSNLGTMGEYVYHLSRLLTEYRDFVRMVDIDDELLRGKHIALTALEDEIEGSYLLKDMKDVVVESLEGAERIKRIVLDMKSFAHPGEDNLQLTDLTKGLESTLNIAWNELKYKAEVVEKYGQMEQVFCFPQQINQVFMNIIVNAGQAIEKEGVITIATSQRRDLVYITISDNGPGMAKDIVEHIFEPFFTTKDVGKGTGLGLNVAYNIIKKHDGHLEVESEVGKGTTFTIILPVQGPKRRDNGV